MSYLANWERIPAQICKLKRQCIPSSQTTLTFLPSYEMCRSRAFKMLPSVRISTQLRLSRQKRHVSFAGFCSRSPTMRLVCFVSARMVTWVANGRVIKLNTRTKNFQKSNSLLGSCITFGKLTKYSACFVRSDRYFVSAPACLAEEGEERRVVSHLGLSGVESAPPAASFQDVACAVGDGVEVELRHVVDPERHAGHCRASSPHMTSRFLLRTCRSLRRTMKSRPLSRRWR